MKSLPTIHTKQNRKRLLVGGCLIYKVLEKTDETLIIKANDCEKQNLNEFLHNVRDNYILDSEVSNNLF